MNMYESCLLHARADRALRALVGLKLERHKLTMMEWLLLGVVNNGPPAGMSMSAVAQTLDVTLPQVTALANKLLSQKLVKQKTQSKDRRSRFIKTTGKGTTVLEEIEDTLRESFKTWLSEIPKDQLDQYMLTVQWLAKNRHPDLASGHGSHQQQAATTPPPVSEDEVPPVV